jgi:hypothetical protein
MPQLLFQDSVLSVVIETPFVSYHLIVFLF